MSHSEPAGSGEGSEASKTPPVVASLHDMTISEAWVDRKGHLKDPSSYITFYVITPDEEIYFGKSSKQKRDMTLADYNAALDRVENDDVYPTCPAGTDLTIAPESLDDSNAYIKQIDMAYYEIWKGTNSVAKALLDKTLIMEQISKSPHPNIIKYHGCRVRHGRITALVLERLEWTLDPYIYTPASQTLDKARFMEALESAVEHLHSLGLAHNDISPYSIMVRDGMPVLAGFDSCQPVGMRVRSTGTRGWCDEDFSTSEKKHDTFSLGKLREWLQNPA